MFVSFFRRQLQTNFGFPASTHYSGKAYFVSSASGSSFSYLTLSGSANFVFGEGFNVIGFQADLGIGTSNLIWDVKSASDTTTSLALSATAEFVLDNRTRHPERFGVDIYDEGLLVHRNATAINFIGDGVRATDSTGFKSAGDVEVTGNSTVQFTALVSDGAVDFVIASLPLSAYVAASWIITATSLSGQSAQKVIHATVSNGIPRHTESRNGKDISFVVNVEVNNSSLELLISNNHGSNVTIRALQFATEV